MEFNAIRCLQQKLQQAKKSNEEISFSDDELEENGVGDYTDIELTFRVYDSK
ncbi:MAG: hypothetical protein ACLR23_04985 [Clostridia bacterium]